MYVCSLLNYTATLVRTTGWWPWIVASLSNWRWIDYSSLVYCYLCNSVFCDVAYSHQACSWILTWVSPNFNSCYWIAMIVLTVFKFSGWYTRKSYLISNMKVIYSLPISKRLERKCNHQHLSQLLRLHQLKITKKIKKMIWRYNLRIFYYYYRWVFLVS